MSSIISIHSYRGGTGKSNSTANLAALLACEGYRVAIVDTDIQSPGIHVLFGFDEERIRLSLNDYLWGKCAIADAAYDVTPTLGERAKPGSQLFLVPSSVKLMDISRIIRDRYDVELLHLGFQELIQALQLDYLLLDTHPGLNEETLLSLTLSDIVLLVLRPDQQDFQGTAVTVDVANRLQVPHVLLLLNKVLPHYDFEDLRQKVIATYDTPVVGIIPLSEDVIDLASNGIFSLKYPEHPLSQIYLQVSQQLMQL